MRSFVVEPMQYGRLFLAGDAAHIVPADRRQGPEPRGRRRPRARRRRLARLLPAAATTDLLEGYSDACLRRVWRAQHFSWWMTSMLHRFDADAASSDKLQISELAVRDLVDGGRDHARGELRRPAPVRMEEARAVSDRRSPRPSPTSRRTAGPDGTHPPLALARTTRRTVLRAPQRAARLAAAHDSTEVTGPLLRRATASATSTTTSPASTTASRSAQRIIVHGRVLDGDGRAVPAHARRDLAGQRRRPLPPRRRPAPGAARPELHRRRARADRRRRPLPLRHDQARRLPVENHHNAWRPAHIHFSLFGRAFAQRLVTQMYFPDDPLFFQDPIFNSVRDPRARERLVVALRPRRRPSRSGRSASASTSCCAGRDATPFESEHDDD